MIDRAAADLFFSAEYLRHHRAVELLRASVDDENSRQYEVAEYQYALLLDVLLMAQEAVFGRHILSTFPKERSGIEEVSSMLRWAETVLEIESAQLRERWDGSVQTRLAYLR